MNVEVCSERVYKTGEDNIVRMGVITSNVLSGFSTWNDNNKRLATDAELIALIESNSSREDILRRCNELSPGGRYGAVHAGEGLLVSWIPVGQKFQIIHDGSSRCERIVYYREEDWICG